jgi:hypothetical protein
MVEAFNSMCVEPLGVPEEHPQRQGDPSMLITLRSGWEQAGIAQDVAPTLHKLRLGIAWIVYRQFASNRRHGSHLFQVVIGLMPMSSTNLRLRLSDSMVNIAHSREFNDPEGAPGPGHQANNSAPAWVNRT